MWERRMVSSTAVLSYSHLSNSYLKDHKGGVMLMTVLRKVRVRCDQFWISSMFTFYKIFL